MSKNPKKLTNLWIIISIIVILISLLGTLLIQVIPGTQFAKTFPLFALVPLFVFFLILNWMPYFLTFSLTGQGCYNAPPPAICEFTTLTGQLTYLIFTIIQAAIIAAILVAVAIFITHKIQQKHRKEPKKGGKKS